MSFMPNNWAAIRHHYTVWHDEIMAAGANEWAGDAYDWDFGIIFMTPIEAWLWHDIRENDAVLYPQYPVGPYFVDFGNPVARVAVECDGAQWHTDKAKDAERDRRLRALGWTVYRITGRDCRIDGRSTDDEQGYVFSPGYLLIQRICEQHGISRFSRAAGDEGEDFVPIGDDIDRIVHKLALAAESRRGVRL